MMKALMIVDVQEPCFFKYDSALLKRINQRILEARVKAQKIVYIQNVKRLRSGRITDDFAAKLLVLTEHVFSKEQADAFSSEKLLAFLQSERISEVELVGIDGNSCISASAKGALQKGYAVSVNLSCTGVANPLRFEKTKAMLSSLGVLLI